METVASLSPASRYSKLSVVTCIVLIVFHIGAVAAFWTFSWTNFFAALALYCIAGGFGISMGYHRLHTHRGFKTYKWFEYFLAICGTLTLEGGPIFWSRRIGCTISIPTSPKIPIRRGSAGSGRTWAG
jgi:stearoyl-CoA desaturase (delta-9 desaturase)